MKMIFVLMMGFSLTSFALENIQADHVKISWLAPQKFGAGTETLGLYFQMDPGWHIYWKNPGDSGAAPKFNFKGKAQTQISAMSWPIPQRLPISHLTNLGYEKTVAFLFDVQPDPKSIQVNFEVKMEWLVCQEECIPGFGTLSLSRSRQAGAKAQWSEADQNQIKYFSERIPASSDVSPWSVQSANLTDKDLQLRLSSKEDLTAPEIFPLDGNLLLPQQPKIEKTKHEVLISIPRVAGSAKVSKTSFVVASSGRAWEFESVPLTAESDNVASQPDLSLWFLLFSAFLGGVILNLMPCVLPVLSIKFISMTQGRPETRVKEVFLYTAGVLSTFAILGGIFLALRSAGSSIGWGFQLQSPLIVLSLILLFWLMALNFLGFFEMGTSTMNWAGRWHNSGSFVTGILSVFVAAPCTGPFMGTALGAAATLNSFSAMMIFLFLGLGLASPFLLLAAFPRALKKMPKPGPWMDSLKQFFAFPLLATVFWLIWVLGVQTGTAGWSLASGLLLLTGFAIWLGKSSRQGFVILAWLVGLGAMAFTGHSILGLRTENKQQSQWQSFSPARLAQARLEHQAVFVDFTAAWCITCQMNKKAVLETAKALQLFQDHKVLLLVADWTEQNPMITEALAKFGRNSVPVYAFYPTDGSEPKILPQILSLHILENLFKTTTSQ